MVYIDFSVTDKTIFIKQAEWRSRLKADVGLDADNSTALTSVQQMARECAQG